MHLICLIVISASENSAVYKNRAGKQKFIER